MNISPPDKMKRWDEEQAANRRYSNASDVVRDLIQREQIKPEKMVQMQQLVDDGQTSGRDRSLRHRASLGLPRRYGA